MSEKKQPWWWPVDKEDKRGYFFVATAAIFAAGLAYLPGKRITPDSTIYGFTQPIVVSTLLFMAVIAAIRRISGPLGPFQFGVIFCLIVVGWSLYGEYAVGRFGMPKDVGGAGDLFGGFSALMSALAFAALLTAQYTDRENRRKSDQQAEERLQQERLTRAEIDERQEKQLALQQEQLVLMRQQMETMVAYFKSVEDFRRQERERYMRSIEPVFTFDWETHQGDSVILSNSNPNGRLRLLFAESDLVELVNEDQLVNGGEAQLRRPQFKDGETLYFTLHYTRSVDETPGAHRFGWPDTKLPHRLPDE